MKRTLAVLALSVAALHAQGDTGYTIHTAAGSAANLGDDGPATAALLRSATAVAAGPGGNLYVVDRSSHQVRRVTPDGRIHTLAGTGTPGYTGDGGPANRAALSSPGGVAVDGAGNVYIADTGNHVIRRVSPGGIITTVAGTGVQGASGDGVSATAASFDSPTGLAVDGGGNLYIADTGNHAVRKMNPAGIVRTVAGIFYPAFGGDGGPALLAGLDSPGAVAVDASGNLYIADTENQRIRRVTTDGVIRTIAGNGNPGTGGDGGSATAAQLYYPQGVAVDGNSNVYIAGGATVRKVTPAGFIQAFAGDRASYGFSGDGGPALAALLDTPRGLAIDGDGNLLVADDYNNRVRAIDTAGIISTAVGRSVEGLPDEASAAAAYFNYPTRVAGDGAGGYYVVDAYNHRVRRISAGGAVTTVAGTGREGFSGDGGPANAATLSYPWGVAADSGGNLYIADTNNSRVRKVTPAGSISTVAGNGNYQFSGDGGSATAAGMNVVDVAVDASGNLYIADRENRRVRKVTPGGRISTVAGNGGTGFGGDGGSATSSPVDPLAVAVDGNGNLYIADYANSRVRKVTTSGIITTVAGNGTWSASAVSGPATSLSLSPGGLAVDAGGNVFITDFDNEYLWKLTPAGTLSVVAGGGLDQAGEGIPSTAARLHTPFGIAAGGGGELWLSEPGGNRIRKLSPGSDLACSVSLSPGSVTVAASAGLGAVTVTASAGCWWTASTDAAWIIVSAAAGNGSGTLAFAFAANPGAERSATITVSGQPVTITQVSAASTVPVLVADPAYAVVNGASFLPGISPGAWTTIRGTNLAPVAAPGRIWRGDEIVDGKLPLSLEGVSVRIDGKPAAMYYVGPGQLNVQAPDTDREGDVEVEVTTPSGTTRGKAHMNRFAPAFFVGARSNARLYVAAVQAVPEADGYPTYIGYPALLPGVRARTAKSRDLISLYGTGFGPSNPARAAGVVIDPADLASQVKVFLGEHKADVLYAGLVAPGLVQINIQVPNLPDGDYLIKAQVGGASTQASLFLTIVN